MIGLGISSCFTALAVLTIGMTWINNSVSRTMFMCIKFRNFWYIICGSCWYTTTNVTTRISWFVYTAMIWRRGGCLSIFAIPLTVCFAWSTFFWWMIWPMLFSMEIISVTVFPIKSDYVINNFLMIVDCDCL